MIRVVWCLVLLSVGVLVRPLAADDWPEWRGAGRLGILTETGLVETFPPDGLPVAWRTPDPQRLLRPGGGRRPCLHH